jgi:hypothetical protein
MEASYVERNNRENSELNSEISRFPPRRWRNFPSAALVGADMPEMVGGLEGGNVSGDGAAGYRVVAASGSRQPRMGKSPTGGKQIKRRIDETTNLRRKTRKVPEESVCGEG